MIVKCVSQYMFTVVFSSRFKDVGLGCYLIPSVNLNYKKQINLSVVSLSFMFLFWKVSFGFIKFIDR